MSALADVAVIVSLVLSAVSMALHLMKKDKAAADVDKAEGFVQEAEGALGSKAPKV